MSKNFITIIVFSILLVIFINGFSASYTSRKIGNLAYVLALGIDVGEKAKLKVSAQFTKRASVSPGSGTSAEDIDNIVIKPCTEFITFKAVDNDKFSKQKYLPLYEDVNSIYDYLDDNITIFKNYEQLSISSNNLFKQCEEYL